MALSKITTESLLNGEITAEKFATGAVTPTPKTVQTHVTATSSQSLDALTVTNVTNLNATITPTAGTKILVTVRWNGEGSHASSQQVVHGLRRDTTIVGSPSSTGSAITYHATISSLNAETLYNNRTVSDPDTTGAERLTSTITLQEVIAP